MSRPTVAVVVPAYNRATMVSETIESILAQSHPADEIIVVDDGSTDATLEVLERYRNSIRILEQPNSGVAVARNRGIRAATADWIALVDSDDRWQPNFLSCCLGIAEGDPEAELIYTRYHRWSGTRLLPNPALGEPPGTNPLRKLLHLRQLCSASSCMIKRSAILSAGAFNEQRDLHPSEDWECWTRLAIRGVKFGFSPEPCAWVRVHGGNTMSDPPRMERSMLRALDAIIAQASEPQRHQIRRELLGSILMRSAVGFYGVGKTRPALQRLMQGAIYRPRLPLQEPLWAWTLLRCLLGDQLSTRLRNLKYDRT